MPIKEEPIRIEFQYEQKDAKTNDGTLNIEYFSEIEGEIEKKYLKISPKELQNDPHIFEVDFFVEVVDFLRSKGVIEDKEQSQLEDQIESRLPLPKIQSTTPTVFSQIDIQSEPVVSHNIPVSSLSPVYTVPAQLSSPVVDSVVSASKIITSESKSDTQQIMIDRPVIRTKIKDNEDPMKAIEESRRQRQSNPEKSIKRLQE